jgi:hypothetical protein
MNYSRPWLTVAGEDKTVFVLVGVVAVNLYDAVVQALAVHLYDAAVDDLRQEYHFSQLEHVAVDLVVCRS